MESRIRIGRTESLFRDVNERIAEASERFDSEEAEFMCECADPACAERVELSLNEYEAVREDATTFVHKPEHIDSAVEQVLERRRGYSVVQKVDEVVARIVRQLDPRAEAA
jgi:hypothetical protein